MSTIVETKNLHLADVKDSFTLKINKNVVVLGPDAYGRYTDVTATGSWISRDRISNLRNASVVTIPRVIKKTKVGSVTMYDTTLGTGFKPNSTPLAEVVANGLMAFAVDRYERQLDPHYDLRKRLRDMTGSTASTEAGKLLKEAVKAGLLELD